MHKCTLPDTTLVSTSVTTGSKLARCYKRSVLIWERNPIAILKYQSEFRFEAERRRHASTHPLIIHPCSKFRTYYEIWMMIVIFATAAWYPIYATLPTNSISRIFRTDLFLYGLLTILNVIDMLMNFVTGYFDTKEEVVLDPKTIRKHYVRTKWFFLDVLMFIVGPTYIFIHDLSRHGRRQHVFAEFCYLYVFKCGKLLKYVKRMCEFVRMSDRKASILKIVLGVALVAHYFACFYFVAATFRWVYGSTYPHPHPDSWLYHYHIELETPLYHLYTVCLYRSVTSLLGIQRARYRWVRRVWDEHLSEAMLYTLGKFLASFLTVLLLEIFLMQNKREREYQETMTQITGYMCRKNVSAMMQQRIVRYYEYRFNRTVFKSTTIRDALSGLLNAQFHLHDISALIKSVSFFEKLDKTTVDCIAKHLKSEYFLEHDVIFRAGEPGDCMYFIQNGTVAVFTPAGEEVCHLEDGAYFGEISLVVEDTTRTASVVSIERCTLYRLDRKALKNCFKDQSMLDELKQVALQRLAKVEEMTLAAAKLFS